MRHLALTFALVCGALAASGQTVNGIPATIGGIDPAGAAAAVAPGETRRAESFTGSDFAAQINACNAYMEANGGGICDDRNFAGAQTTATQINIGQAGTSSTVVHLFPAVMHWTCSMSDGTSSCVKVYNGGVITTDNPGGGAGRAVLDTSSGASMDSVLSTDAGQAGGIYVKIEGVSVYNTGNATLANGAAHVQNLDDQSDLTRLYVQNFYGNGFVFEGIGCGAAFHELQAYTSSGYPGDTNAATDYGHGGIPLTIRNLSNSTCTQAIAFYDSTFNAPKTGSPNISIGGSQTGIVFVDVYAEGNGGADTTTPMVYIASAAGSVRFDGGSFNSFCAAACPTKFEFENHTSNYFAIAGVGRGAYSSWINDAANSATPAAPAIGTAGNYSIGSAPDYFRAVASGTSEIDPRYYGVVGDGVTDDTAAWAKVMAVAGNSAAASCGNNSTAPTTACGATVKIPAGMTSVASNIVMPSYVTLRGVDRWTSLLIQKAGANQHFVTVAGASTTLRTAISNLSINGNSANQTGAFDCIHYAQSGLVGGIASPRHKFENLNIQSCSGNGIYTYTDAGGFEIFGNKLHDNGNDGLYFHSPDSIVQNNEAYHNTGYGFELRVGASRSVGNYSWGNTLTGIFMLGLDWISLNDRPQQNVQHGIYLNSCNQCMVSGLIAEGNGPSSNYGNVAMYNATNSRVEGYLVGTYASTSPSAYNISNFSGSGNANNYVNVTSISPGTGHYLTPPASTETMIINGSYVSPLAFDTLIPATSSSVQPGAGPIWKAHAYNGSADYAETFTAFAQAQPTSGTTTQAQMVFKYTGALAGPVFTFAQGNAASSSQNWNSPSLQLSAAIYNGSASTYSTFGWTDVVGTGANPTETYTLSHVSGGTGTARVSIPYSTVFGSNVTATGYASALHYGSSSAAPPTVTLGTGGGSTASTPGTAAFPATPLSTDYSMDLNITTGSSTTASATVATITFASQYAYTPKCKALPNNAATQALTGVAQAQIYTANSTQNAVQLTAGATALPASTALSYEITCTQ